MNVRALIFSGRPDPQWIWNRTSIETLFHLLRTATVPTDQRLDLQHSLGYCGFMLWDDTQEILVYKQLIQIRKEGSLETRFDAERIIEKLLASHSSIPAKIAQRIIS
jgi:hypothetical protein